MSLDPPAYISSLQNNIRARPISWEGAVRAKTITEEDLKKIKAIDKVRKEQRKQTIEGDVKTYTQLLLGGDDVKSIFESAAKRTDILQYMLVLAGDLVDGARYLTAEHSNHTANTIQTFPNSHSRWSSTLNPSSLSSHC
jgi:V-type H+-transporting ATPase subunit H